MRAVQDWPRHADRILEKAIGQLEYMQTGLFRRAVRIGLKSHCASCHGWVFLCKRRAVLFRAPQCYDAGQSLAVIVLHGILAQ